MRTKYKLNLTTEYSLLYDHVYRLKSQENVFLYILVILLREQYYNVRFHNIRSRFYHFSNWDFVYALPGK